MSTTTTEDREPGGIVADALRRPIEDAIREGVKEAMREQEAAGSERDGGRRRGAWAGLALVGLGVAALLYWRRRGRGAADRSMAAQSIRTRAKAGQDRSTDTGASASGADEGTAGEREAEAEGATADATSE